MLQYTRYNKVYAFPYAPIYSFICRMIVVVFIVSPFR